MDPGCSGGIAYSLGESLSVVAAMPMPDTEGAVKDLLMSILEEANGELVRVVVEEVGGYMGEQQPASRAFEFGKGYGFILGILQTLGARIELVRPQAWQKVLALGTSGRTRSNPGAGEEERATVKRFNAAAKREWKRKLKEKAQQLFPGVDVTLKTCDALLLLEYCRRTESP